MKHATFSLQFLTPAFLGGAFPKREGEDGPQAELRISSILGQLRWWHRALGRMDSEARIFGMVAGNSGHAAGFSLQLQNAPESVTGATTPKSLGLAGSYFLYAQEMDQGANHRAALSKDSCFKLIVINRRLSEPDWNLLLDTINAFAWLGALGNRSRRGFGALRLLECNGKEAANADPVSLLQPHLACAFPNDCKPAHDVPGFVTNAGNWLREARRRLKDAGHNKSSYFGRTSGNHESRLSSPILMRPWREDGSLKLLLIGPRELIADVAEPCGCANAPAVTPHQSEVSDPVADLLRPPLTFDRFKVIKTAVESWRNQGRPDLIAKLLDETKDGKYAGLRSQPWFPKTQSNPPT